VQNSSLEPHSVNETYPDAVKVFDLITDMNHDWAL
jgi:hypothetical protein